MKSDHEIYYGAGKKGCSINYTVLRIKGVTKFFGCRGSLWLVTADV
jgi:hypothetical protein